jgi:hypothetical protein
MSGGEQAGDLADLGGPHLFVFGHPNHELAVFGALQRLRPATVFLTDGGGPERLDQTREGLAAIGLLERATFLGFDENDFYAELLGGETSLFRQVAAAVRPAIAAAEPACLFADAVEFYNPVHDLTLPIALAALDGRPARCFEVPLIYESADEAGRHVVQRVAPWRGGGLLQLTLTPAELAAKRRARDHVYTRLVGQLQPLLGGLTDAELAREDFAAAAPVPRPPAPGQALRYEHRGELLHRQGKVGRVIRYAEHYAPVAAALAGGGGAA